MKAFKTLTARILALALIPMMVCLASCGMTLKEAGSSGAIDKDSGVAWKHASTCYEAITLGKKVGKLNVTEKYTLNLHEIEDMDPSLWLATEEGNVLYTHQATLPTLAEMKPTSMLICVENETSRVLGNLQDAQKIDAIISAYTQNESLVYPAISMARTYRVRFVSPDYPGIYYTLTYVEYAEDYVHDEVNYGKYFLYSAFDKVFVPVGDEIHVTLGLG